MASRRCRHQDEAVTATAPTPTTPNVGVEDLVAAVHALGEHLGQPVELLVGHSLGGAAVLSAARQLSSVRAVASIAAPSEPAHVEHLLRRYGSLTDELLDLMRERPALREPIDGASGYLRAEAVYAASHEGALHLEDTLTRRTRISIETFDRGLVAAGPTARSMAGILGWDEPTLQGEIAHYEARVRAERESQSQPDDQTADAARMGAPDVRLGAASSERAPVVSLDERRNSGE